MGSQQSEFQIEFQAARDRRSRAEQVAEKLIAAEDPVLEARKRVASASIEVQKQCAAAEFKAAESSLRVWQNQFPCQRGRQGDRRRHQGIQA